MFTQVYFHKTRVIYDYHLQRALAQLLPSAQFPEPKGKSVDQYLAWNDWRVLGLLGRGKGGEHGKRLGTRDHFREIHHTSERPSPQELKDLQKKRGVLGGLLAAEVRAEKSWYKIGPADIQVLSEGPTPTVAALSRFSSVVPNIDPIRQVRLYARPEDRAKALEIINSM